MLHLTMITLWVLNYYSEFVNIFAIIKFNLLIFIFSKFFIIIWLFIIFKLIYLTILNESLKKILATRWD
jgi:hypothetical protein